MIAEPHLTIHATYVLHNLPRYGGRLAGSKISYGYETVVAPSHMLEMIAAEIIADCAQFMAADTLNAELDQFRAILSTWKLVHKDPPTLLR